MQAHLDKIHNADVSDLFKEDPAKETMQMEASHVEAAMSDSSSMESYNRVNSSLYVCLKEGCQMGQRWCQEVIKHLFCI